MPRTVLLFLLALGSSAPRVLSAQAPRAADVASMESILTALYDVISGPAGQKRDWDRMRSLFVPGARLIPAVYRPDSVPSLRMLTVEQYIERSGPQLESNGFFEREIARRVERYGGVVHVFSTYESRRTAADPTPFARGINSIQLWNDGRRWWIVTIYWEGERQSNPIPPGYLKNPGDAGSDTEVAITHVGVVDVERGRVIPDQTVLIKGNRLVTVGPSGRARPAGSVRVIDGTGKYLIPGLWDMHAHLAISGNPTGVEMPLMVAHGVTGVRVMIADRPSLRPTETRGLDQHRGWQALLEAGTLTGPRLLALGSWSVNGAGGISDSMPPFYKARTREEGQQLARYFKERGFDFVKIYNNVSREGYLGLAEEARRLGLPFAGHEPGSLSAVELSNAGQKSIEHSRVFLFNCFAGADSLQEGLLRISPTVRYRRMIDEYDPKRCAEVFRTFAKNGTWITPTHLTRKMDAFADDSAYRGDARMKYLPLAQRVSWLQDADGMVASDASPAGRKAFMDFYLRGLALTNAAYRAGVPVMLGTDAGDSFVFPGAGVHDELGELVKAGLTPAEALKAATLSGATYLGRSADFGTVQAGRFADLVLLDANPLADIGNTRRIHAVVLNGRVVDRAGLDALLAGVEAAVRPDKQARLWAGATLGDTTMIAQAVAEGANLDSLDSGGSGRRALNYAAYYNRAAAVRMLIARGAQLNLANRTGFTPLHHAAETGANDALRILIDSGADLTLATGRGQRALDMARGRSNNTAIQLLEAAAKKP